MTSDFDNLTTYDNPPDEERVRALLCSDQKGQVQVIAPVNALVDPEPIRETTARQLRGVPNAEDASVCAIPGYYGLPSVIHAELKHRDQLALETEIPGQFVRATGTQLHQLSLTHASFETQFCEELIATPSQNENDDAQILTAIESFTTRRIEARLDETLSIPPLPETAQRIIALQQDPNYDLNDLVTIVEADPAIAARIMGWANSAMYAHGSVSKTLNDAIMRTLGFDMVFNMALGMAIGASLNLPKSHVSGASPYWLDAVYTAATMESLARHCNKDTQPNSGVSYLIGLLSNFGTLVVGHVFPPQYETICRIQEANPQHAYPHIDQHVLKVNREVIAATLLELWDLPTEITTAIRFQNVGFYEGEHETYVHLLRLSLDMLCHGAAGLHEDSKAAAAKLGIGDQALADVAELILESQSELGEIAATFAR